MIFSVEIFGKVESKSPVTQKDSFEIDMFVGLMKFKDSRKFSFEKLEDVRKKTPQNTTMKSERHVTLATLVDLFFLLTMQHAAVMQPRLHSHEIGASELLVATARPIGDLENMTSSLPWMKGIGFASPEDEHFAHNHEGLGDHFCDL